MPCGCHYLGLQVAASHHGATPNSACDEACVVDISDHAKVDMGVNTRVKDRGATPGGSHVVHGLHSNTTPTLDVPETQLKRIRGSGIHISWQLLCMRMGCVAAATIWYEQCIYRGIIV